METLSQDDIIKNIIAMGTDRTRECIAIYDQYAEHLATSLTMAPEKDGCSDNPFINTTVPQLIDALLFKQIDLNDTKGQNLLMNRLDGVDLGIRIGSLIAYHEQAVRNKGQSVPGGKSELSDIIKADFLKSREEFQRSLVVLEDMAPELSEVSKLSIKVAAYLRGEYPKASIDVTKLYDLTEKYKEEGRQFLRHHLGGNLQTDNLIKDVFRSPRKSKERSMTYKFKKGEYSQEE